MLRRLLLAAVVEAVLAALASGSEPPPVRQPPPVKAPAPPQAPPARVVVEEKPKPRRVRMAGYWWDDLGDGTFRWGTPCNGPYPAAGVPGMVLVRP